MECVYKRLPQVLRYGLSALSVSLLIVVLVGCGGGTTSGSPSPAANTGANTGSSANTVVVAVPLVIPNGQAASASINPACPGGGIVNPVTLIAWGGSPISGYTWSLANGSHYPPGTTVDPLTGVFHGIPGNSPLVAGDYTVQMEVSDNGTTATGSLSVHVGTDNSGVCGSALFEQSHLGTFSLPAAKNSNGYGASLYADGNGALPWHWELASANADGTRSTLPGGVVIDMARGVVRGTPDVSASGQTFRFSLVVTDANGKKAECPCATYQLPVN